MKVFNKKASNCIECKFYSIMQLKCNYLNESVLNKVNNFNLNPFKEIYEYCPFNKPVTKEDIESLGFKQTLNPNYFEKQIDNHLFTLTINKDGSFSLSNQKFLAYPMFDHIKITSKPHLEFILQTLNIIK